MSEKKTIKINDFDLFCETIKSTAKILDSVKFKIDENGLQIYGARNKIARCEITTNSIFSDSPIEFSILDLSMLVKILGTVQTLHAGDYSGFKFIYDLPFIRFESKKFKTKLTTCNEDIIAKWVSKKIEAALTPVFEFTTTPDYIKQINQHAYVVLDQASTRIYLELKDDMEKNALFATIGNRESNLSNEVTLKFGVVTFGTLSADRKLVLDLERLNLFNAYPSKQIKISLMNMNVLVSKITASGKNGSFLNLNIYNTILKS